jgi:hypothetical protein
VRPLAGLEVVPFYLPLQQLKVFDDDLGLTEIVPAMRPVYFREMRNGQKGP